MTKGSAGDPIVKTEPCCPIVYSTVEVDLSYDKESFDKIFAPAFFNSKTNSLHYESFDKIKFVQIYNDEGEMKYQLPVMSNKMRLNKNMFDSGSYKIAFILEDSSEVINTFVSIH